MVATEFKDIFPENNENTILPENMGILSIKEFRKKYKEEIDSRIDFTDLKVDFKEICDLLLKNKIKILEDIFSKIQENKKLNLWYIDPKKDFEDYTLIDIENIIYKIWEKKFSEDSLIYDLYSDYLWYSNLLNESKRSLFNQAFINIEEYVFNESKHVLDKEEREELVWEIIDDIEDKFDNIDFSDKYLFEKINKIVETIKLNFIVAWNLFDKVKWNEIQKLSDLNKVDIWIKYKVINTKNLKNNERQKLLEDLMILYYKNYDEKTQKDFLYEVKEFLKEMIYWWENEEFHLFEIDHELALSLYFKNESSDTLYMWWFNSNNIFTKYWFWFWALERILETKKDKNIKAWVLTKVDWFKKWWFERIIYLYEKLLFYKSNNWKRVKLWDLNEYIEIIRNKAI